MGDLQLDKILDVNVPSLEEEYNIWRDQYVFEMLTRSLWTPSQIETFWSAARSNEDTIRQCRDLQLQVHSLHPQINKVAAIVYQLK